jgi:low affinity Fe/Cu permease
MTAGPRASPRISADQAGSFRAQTKDSIALHLKINELLAALNKASPGLINIEDLGEGDLTQLPERYQEILRGRCRRGLHLSEP